MMNPLSLTNVHTDEDFAKVLKRKINLSTVLFIIGALTIIILLFTTQVLGIASDSHQQDFFSGFGSALMVCGIALFIKNRRTLNNPERLRAMRIKYTDERTLNIHTKSIMVAAGVLLAGMYLLCLIVGLVYPTYFPLLIKLLLSLVCLFLLTFRIAFMVYNKKM